MEIFIAENILDNEKKTGRQLRFDQPIPPTPRAKSINSCSSASRFFPNRDSSDSAQSISFRDSKSSLSSKYDASNKKLYINQCFEVICKLGSGSFGDVFKARCKQDGKYYAVKRAKEKFAGKADRDRKLKEVQKHEQLPNHPTCVRFYKAWEEKKHLYIQTELCLYSLCQFADIHPDIPEKTIWNFLVDLLQAVKHLHEHNLVHLDIKPDNIFISDNNVCKLGDFGLVLDLSVKSERTNAIEGDPRYIAPELMDGIFTKAADVFSVGITILELASDLDLPRNEESWHQLRNLAIPEEFLQGLSSSLIEVISLMMEPNYTKRSTAADILALENVDKVYRKRRRLYSKFSDSGEKVRRSMSFQSPPEWNNSISDEVFDTNSNGSCGSLNNFQLGRKRDLDLFFNDNSNSSFELSRARIGMSTPCSFRYWDSELHNSSGSPSLSGSKKKELSPSDDTSQPYVKSPRLQLFQDDSSGEENDQNVVLPSPKNLLRVFNSLTP